MTSYIAFIRGIMPMNPNMRNEKLRGVFEKLGFADVQTIISSGNVIFKSSSKKSVALEKKIENALLSDLGLKNAVIIRSKDELEKIIQKNPFKGKEHGRQSYLIVTFLKEKPREIFSVLDLTKSKTPDFMTMLEKKHGKVITTRTWKTVEKIVKKL
jgi:uncharacterized protein (DUF1697 family)